jgi:hypothetical protein
MIYLPPLDDIIVAHDSTCEKILKFPVDKDQKMLFGAYAAKVIGRDNESSKVRKRTESAVDSGKKYGKIS